MADLGKGRPRRYRSDATQGRDIAMRSIDDHTDSPRRSGTKIMARLSSKMFRRALAAVVFAVGIIVALLAWTGADNNSIRPESSDVEDWTLAWSDEFNAEAGNAADSRYWTYETGGQGWGNRELQYYTDSTDNAAHDGAGHLVITMREIEDPSASGLVCWYGPCLYTSARLITEDKVEITHGRVEVRVKLPAGEAGIWPAFWALGGNFREVDWPQSGEIDVMEFVGKLPDEVFGTVHGPGYSGAASIGDIHDFEENLGGQWMTFSVEWDEEVIRWYAQRDGEDPVQFLEVTPDSVAPHEWVFENSFFFIANMAVGGDFGGALSTDLTFPQQYLLDYVRVYQAPDSADRFVK